MITKLTAALAVAAGLGVAVLEARRRRAHRAEFADQLAAWTARRRVPAVLPDLDDGARWHCDGCARTLALEPDGLLRCPNDGCGWVGTPSEAHVADSA